MLTFIKFGGSVITDKTGQEAPDLSTIRQLAAEVRAARDRDHNLRLIIGHGSGSFGHTYARRYGIHTGIAQGGDWMGFALTAAAALRLNRIVVEELLAAGIPALALQPSASLLSRQGALLEWHTAAITRALDHDIVPVVHGDVAFDETQGSSIMSTEQLLERLVYTPALSPARIILIGETGVYTHDPRADPHAERIPHIDATNIAAVLRGTGGSHGVDVTGGMRAKVELIWRLVEATPGLAVQLIGPQPGLLMRALLDQATGEGTLIAT
ncbi:MAG: isopentenyl phosphate kinase [Roseiflexaceae bacterium]